MTALGLLVLAWSGAVRAEAALDGSTGILTVPRAETIPWAQGQVSAAVSGTQTWEGGAINGLPVGAAFGMGSKTEIGVRLGTDGLMPAPDQTLISAFGAHVRRRIRNAMRGRAAWAVQADLNSIDQDPGGSIVVIREGEGQGSLYAVTAGPRFSVIHGPDLAGAVGAQFRLSSQSQLLAEATAAVSLSGMAELSARVGGRVRVRERILLTGWAGGGQFEQSPWAGLGLAFGLHTVDLALADRDGDEVVDWSDRCRYDAEDVDGWEDEDGCPDDDNDGDGVLDVDDPTPNGEVLEEDVGYPTPTPTLKMRVLPRERADGVDRSEGD